MSGSMSKSESSQRSQSTNQGASTSRGYNQGTSGSQQNVWQPQQGALQGLYEGAGNELNNTINTNNQMQPQMMESWNNIMNPGVNAQLQAYQNQVMQNFNENIMPAIGDNASMAGGFGGTRQGVAQGVAGRGANQQMTDMASNLYNQDMNRMLQGIQMAPQVSNQNMDSYGRYANMLGSPTVLGNSQAQNTGMTASDAWNRAQSSGYGESKSKASSGGVG